MSSLFGFTYGWEYVAVTTIMVCAYSWFTIRASDWRIQIRRDMNNSDTDANSKAVDSLLNFETVKYFSNEDMEARRFDKSRPAQNMCLRWRSRPPAPSWKWIAAFRNPA